MTVRSPAALDLATPGTGSAVERRRRLSGPVREARKALLVWQKDVRVEWRSLDSLPAMFFFALLVLVIFNFGFDLSSARFSDFGPGVLWVAFAFSGVLAFGNSFALERDADCIQGLRLAPVDPGSLYLGKLLANCTSMLIVEAAVLPLCAVMFDYDLAASIGPMSVVLLVHTVGFGAVGTLFGGMTARTRRGDVLLPILLFSISVPFMLSAVRLTGAALAGEPISEAPAAAWLVMAGVFDLVFIAAAYLTFEYILEE